MSKQENLSQDFHDFNKKSREWNDSDYRTQFKQMQIYISNEKNTSLYLIDDEEKMHKYDDNEKLYYNALQKVNRDISPLISNIKLAKKKSDASVK